MSLIVQGAILPHAPLLARETTGPEADGIARVKDAIRGLSFDVDALVVLSPHGGFTGLYASGHASLRGFGLESPRFEVPIDTEVTDDLTRGWNAGARDDDLDHGVVVPLALTGSERPVVAATISEDAGARAAIERGRSFADALASTAKRLALVASAHTGAALSPRAPLGLREEAHDVERRLVEHLTAGTGDGDAVLEDLARVGGSCGAGPLTAFAELCAGRTTVLAHEAPFGVGYLVATAEL